MISFIRKSQSSIGHRVSMIMFLKSSARGQHQEYSYGIQLQKEDDLKR